MLNQKHGVSTVAVVLHEYQNIPAIYKYFKTVSKFDREYSAYMKLTTCDFIPSILYSDRTEKLLVLSYMGKSLDIKYKPKDRYIFKPQIQILNDILRDTYGIFHNDMRWKNVIESDDNKLYIIDFEKWTPHEHDVRERTLEKIGR